MAIGTFVPVSRLHFQSRYDHLSLLVIDPQACGRELLVEFLHGVGHSLLILLSELAAFFQKLRYRLYLGSYFGTLSSHLCLTATGVEFNQEGDSLQLSLQIKDLLVCEFLAPAIEPAHKLLDIIFQCRPLNLPQFIP